MPGNGREQAVRIYSEGAMIQLNLHPVLEARLVERADKIGIPVEQYIAEKLQASEPFARRPESETTAEERVADMERFIEDFGRFSHEIPPGHLHNSTFDREFIYQDHD